MPKEKPVTDFFKFQYSLFLIRYFSPLCKTQNPASAETLAGDKIVLISRGLVPATAATVPATTAISATTVTTATAAVTTATVVEVATRAVGEFTAGALFARAGFVNDQVHALELKLVELGNGLTSLLVVRHLNETKAPAAARFAIHNDLGVTDFAVLLKQGADFIFRGPEGNFCNVNVHRATC